MWVIICVIIVTVLLFFYKRLSEKNKYWIKKGVKQGSPVIIFGDKARTVTHSQSLSDMVQNLYNLGTKDDRYTGAYDFMSPALVLRDPDLIRDILVKDFNHFTDHKRVIPEDSDPVWGNNLFFLTGNYQIGKFYLFCKIPGEKWRDMRNTLSPAFTGAKLRHLFVTITRSAEQFVDHFAIQHSDVTSVEMKDIFARFTSDTIANAVFGFRCNSLEESNNKFFEMAKKITDFSGFWQAVRMFGYFIVPKLYKTFNIRILSNDVANFFYFIVKENIDSRRKQKLVNQDMINLLLEARENEKLIRGIGITDEDITAQAIVFLFAGFDSVSSSMTFMAYELALNPEVQEKLRKEVDETAEKCGGQLSYEDVKSMKYLDMVVSETLRKWPITPFVNRVCTKPYTIAAKNPGENPIDFKDLDVIILPIYGLHRDPKYYPDPERFDPERFNSENIAKLNPYIYLPFGTGPRKCIGYRFALIETKILFYFILSKFEIVVNGKTQIPVQLCKKSINMTPESGLWLDFKRRNK